jgi:hypothetical protein
LAYVAYNEVGRIASVTAFGLEDSLQPGDLRKVDVVIASCKIRREDEILNWNFDNSLKLRILVVDDTIGEGGEAISLGLSAEHGLGDFTEVRRLCNSLFKGDFRYPLAATTTPKSTVTNTYKQSREKS